MHYDDGSIYEGGFKYDKRHGFGKCWFADGSYYEGCWINDLQDGYGMFVQGKCLLPLNIQEFVILLHHNFISLHCETS